MHRRDVTGDTGVRCNVPKEEFSRGLSIEKIDNYKISYLFPIGASKQITE